MRVGTASQRGIEQQRERRVPVVPVQDERVPQRQKTNAIRRPKGNDPFSLPFCLPNGGGVLSAKRSKFRRTAVPLRAAKKIGPPIKQKAKLIQIYSFRETIALPAND